MEMTAVCTARGMKEAYVGKPKLTELSMKVGKKSTVELQWLEHLSDHKN